MLIAFVDFIVYELLDRMFEPKRLDSFKNLKDFLDRFEVFVSWISFETLIVFLIISLIIYSGFCTKSTKIMKLFSYST